MPSNVWRGHLTFGLVSIPVRLLRAARKERVRMHYVHRPSAAPAFEEPDEPDYDPPKVRAAGSSHVEPWPGREAEAPEPEQGTPPVERVKQSLVTSDESERVSRSELLRGYEVEPDRYVVLEPHELKGLQRRTSSTMEIVRAVQLSEIDPVFFETSYYLVPDKGGERPYSMLFAALRDTGRVALARVGMYGREHVVIVRPGKNGLLAHTMFFVDEIRFDNEFHADVQSVSEKELSLARMFLEAIEGPFAPDEFKDTYREELQAMISKKMADAGLAPAKSAPAAAAPAPAIDILEALKKSIAMAKKPVASVTEIKPKKQARKAR